MHQATGFDKLYWLRDPKKKDSMHSVTVRGNLFHGPRTEYFPISHITWWGFYTMKLKMKEE